MGFSFNAYFFRSYCSSFSTSDASYEFIFKFASSTYNMLVLFLHDIKHNVSKTPVHATKILSPFNGDSKKKYFAFLLDFFKQKLFLRTRPTYFWNLNYESRSIIS